MSNLTPSKNKKKIYDSAVGREGGGARGAQPLPPSLLADQLTLSQPWGVDSPHPVLRAPWNFRPRDGPVMYIVTQITIFPHIISTLE